MHEKVCEVIRQATEKSDCMRTLETKQRTAEKEQHSKLKEVKQRHREKVAELQKRFEEVLAEKMKEAAVEVKGRIEEYENKIKTLQA